ncbi:MAG: hypothetical protein CSA68_04065 [Rhodobacterales bacterium]|nr:MAG: hypothetical protein CSA68_04065 [Rhodobacterales bacterium]
MRVKDLMNVRRGYVDPKVKPAFFNGEPAIILSVEMRDGSDIQVLGRVLKEKLPQFENTQPIGISYNWSTF